MHAALRRTLLGRLLLAALVTLLPVAPLHAAPAGPPPDLRNPGFEDRDPLTAWRTWVYAEGKEPTIRTDPQEPHEGRQSLLIHAEDPADVALGQEVSLPAGSIWRVRGWVRTTNLVARDRTETGGSIHVQAPEGTTLARGPSTFGTSPWHELAVPFRVPINGRVKIVLFSIGYGKGTGSVGFDALRLEPIDTPGGRRVRVANERLTRRAVDAKQGGQFIELLCGLIPSMLAQQVANTSFELDPAWKVAFRRETDRPNRPWYPDGAVHLARYEFDTNQPFNGARALRIELPAQSARAGISQEGFHVQARRAFRVRLHARGHGPPRIRATLHGGGRRIALPLDLGTVGPQWRTLEGRVTPDTTLDNATLTFDFEGPGTLWLDRVTAMADDAVLGLWRPDVVEALRALKPAVIRFGGSTTEDYEWDQSVGPWDSRAPFPVRYWGGLEENFVGLEEFAALCREVGAEPLVCLRWTGKRPEDAAAQVEYFNGPASTPQGRRRAQNGHPQPWAIKYWQIGNEVGGADYERSLPAFAAAMRQVDPSIKILSAFPSAATLSAAAGQVDYLCPHHYGCADLEAVDRDFLALEDQIRRLGGTRDVRIAVTEWNTTAGDWGLGRATLQTLANALACARYHHLMHRHADAVEIAIRSNLIDSFGSGVIQTGLGWLYLAPTYHAQRLYAEAAGSHPLCIEPEDSSPAAPVPWVLEEPDLSAVLSPDGRVLRIYGVNSTAQPIAVTTELAGFGRGVKSAEKAVLQDTQGSGTAEVMNHRDDPERVRVIVSPARIRSRRFDLEFGPFSLTRYRLELGRP